MQSGQGCKNFRSTIPDYFAKIRERKNGTLLSIFPFLFPFFLPFSLQILVGGGALPTTFIYVPGSKKSQNIVRPGLRTFWTMMILLYYSLILHETPFLDFCNIFQKNVFYCLVKNLFITDLSFQLNNPLNSVQIYLFDYQKKRKLHKKLRVLWCTCNPSVCVQGLQSWSKVVKSLSSKQ